MDPIKLIINNYINVYIFKIIVVILLLILVIILLTKSESYKKNYFSNIDTNSLVINDYNDYMYLIGTNPNFMMTEIQYKNVITDIYNNNPELMEFVNSYDIYSKNNSLIDINTYESYKKLISNNLDSSLLLTRNEYNSIVSDACKNNNVDPALFNDYDNYFTTGILTLSF